MPQSFSLNSLLLVGLVIVLLSPVVCAENYLETTAQFQQWYPRYNRTLTNILTKNCTSEYEWYLTHAGMCTWEGHYCSDTPIISCLLDNLPQAVQSEMNAAAVVLGLLPTVLGMVASSPVETGLVALRRPLLMSILFISTPALPLVRGVDYRATVKQVLKSGADHQRLIKVSRPLQAHLISALQYLVALAMLANIAELTYELMFRVVFAAVPHTILLPVLYIMSTTICQIFAALAVRLHVRASDAITSAPRRTSLRRILKEFQPCISQSGWTLTFRENSFAFQFMAWLTSVATVVLIVCGTFMYSSALFVGQADAMIIAVRLLANIVVGRMILVYELHGMGHAASVRSPSEFPPATTYESVSMKPLYSEEAKQYDRNFTLRSVGTDDSLR